VGLRDGFRRVARGVTGPRAVDGSAELHVGDPRFDDWPVVRDFEGLDDARAWRQQLEEAGVEAVLTSDWQLDEFGRGDIALRVPPGMWSEAEEALDSPDV
jgi:hypothetical protein